MVALLPLVALFAAQERITKELGSAEIIERGLRAKLRTVVDAWPMIADHPWLGIGRGAFISVHTGYKSSEEQLLYVFPENIVAQLVVEWGWPVALGCLLALVVALATRLLRVSHSAKLGALAGLCAVVFQNLVDFSLELPGVAVIAAAILGGTGGMIFRDHRAQPSAWRRMAVVGSAASIAVIALGFWGLVAGTPRLGAEALDRAIAARRSDQPSLDAAEVEAIAARHPASADIAARVAFWAEVSRPPDFPKAFHWANRALYLAPNYADAHLLSGRLLVKAGYRKQGFEAMRRGWELSASDRRQSFIDEVIRLAVTSTEALLATPRRDPELDLPSEAELLRLARQVARRDRAPWIADVLEQIRDFELLSSEHLQLVARLAENEGAWPVAARALAALERRGPLAPRAAQLQVELVRQTQGATAAIAALDALLAQPQQATVELLRTRLDLAIAQKDLARAQAVLAEMEVLSRADYRGQADLEHDRARVALAEGRTAKAARALGRALQLDPTNIRWRLERARALIVLNRHAEAGVELKFVLDVHPGHAGAVALLRGLSKAPIP
jgi:tetratricopeptide (TPR) repeat protein